SQVMADASGRGHDGDITNVTLGVPGDVGTAYSFDAATSIVRVPSADDLNPGTLPLQISAHLRVPASLTSGDYNVIQKGTATASGGAYKLEISAKTGSKFGHPDCAFNSAAGKNRVFGKTSVADGKWHVVECHLSTTQAWVTIDGRDGPKSARVAGSIANASALTVGGKTNNTHYFNGDLDEVAITIG
ncbi:MAG: LamG-like jellyroll fold domain-containing protein, partial [Oryzihumus sp.]